MAAISFSDKGFRRKAAVRVKKSAAKAPSLEEAEANVAGVAVDLAGAGACACACA